MTPKKQREVPIGPPVCPKALRCAPWGPSLTFARMWGHAPTRTPAQNWSGRRVFADHRPPPWGSRGPGKACRFCHGKSILQPPPATVRGSALCHPAPSLASLPRYLFLIFLTLPGLAQAENKQEQPGHDSPGSSVLSHRWNLPSPPFSHRGSVGEALRQPHRAHAPEGGRAGHSTAWRVDTSKPRLQASWGGCTAPGNAEALTQGWAATTTACHPLISARTSPRTLSS